MYFLGQIKNQFFSSIAVYTAGEGAMDSSPRPQRRPEDEEQKSTLANLSPEQLAKLESLEDIKREIDGIQSGEKIVKQRITAIGGFLERTKFTPTPEANTNDTEYGQLFMTYDRLVKEYDVLSKDNRALLIYLNDTLSKFEGEVDKKIAEIIGPVEEKDFSLEEIKALETKRAAEKETAEKTFITFLGAKYVAGTDLSTYAQNFVGTPFEETFQQYQEAIKAPEQKTEANADTYRNNMEHVNTKGQIYAYDIEAFQDITAKNTIALRDERLVDGKKFGEIRDESAQSQLERFVSETTDQQLKDILAPNGETIKFSELSAAHIAMLHEKGFDIKPFLFVNEKGESIQAEDYKNGGVFFLNTAGNENLEGILEMNLIDEISQTLTIEGQLATYKTEDPAGYYYPNGEKVILRDGMKIEVSPLGTTTPDTTRAQVASEGLRTIMGNEVGSQLQNKPEILSILDKMGSIGQFIASLLTSLGFIKNPEGGGGYGYTDASGKWVALNEGNFSSNAHRSEPAERSETGTTLCSRTAWKNLKKLGVTNHPRGGSAKESYEAYGKQGDTSFPNGQMSEGQTVADLYLDASPKNAKYGHRVAAYKEEGKWFILDPYYAIPGQSDRLAAIPAEKYMNHMCGSKGRKFWGAQYPKQSESLSGESAVA